MSLRSKQMKDHVNICNFLYSTNYNKLYINIYYINNNN